MNLKIFGILAVCLQIHLLFIAVGKEHYGIPYKKWRFLIIGVNKHLHIHHKAVTSLHCHLVKTAAFATVKIYAVGSILVQPHRCYNQLVFGRIVYFEPSGRVATICKHRVKQHLFSTEPKLYCGRCVNLVSLTRRQKQHYARKNYNISYFTHIKMQS